jgi:hypothetical protein
VKSASLNKLTNMRTKTFRTASLLLQFSIVAGYSAPIQNLTFTEVIKDVFVIDPSTKKETPAKAGDTLVPPNVLKTGADSRAELIAEDKTVTRVGSNTIFSVEANSRDVNLAQGSVLFHSPAGRGGGRIKSAGATASVLGTTLAVSANSDGGFKTSLLEGKGEVKDPKGGKVGLAAGQVTFAKPGGGLSPALNFDLKAQISNSKLVGGFSTPLASLAKIEAAVAVQQAKIAGGALTSTGMLIGDRPDTAFKVDAAIVDGQIRQAQTRREEQEKAAEETQTFYEVDPRYLARVVKTIQDSLGEPVLSTLVLAQPLEGGGVNQTAPASNIFIIDRTGRASLAPEIPNAIGGVPSNLPGNRQDTSVTYHALIANEISLTLNPKELGSLQNATIQTVRIGTDTLETRLTLATGLLPDWLTVGTVITGNDILPGTMVSSISNGVAILNQSPLKTVTGGAITAVEPAPFFLPMPLIDKVGGAILARQNLEFTGTIDFVGLDNIETHPDGFETGQTLLLSAGKTIKIAPGSMLVANTNLFEIYAGGSSFAGDLSLTLTPLGANETPVPLTLDRVALINRFPLDPDSKSNGTIRITAPEINLTDTLILGGSDSSEVAIESAGAISIQTASGALGDAANMEATSKLLVSLGFTNTKDLCIKAFKVGIQSESKTVTINGVSLYANDITLRGGDELKLSSVIIDPFDFQREQSLTASARNNVTIESGIISGQDRPQMIPAATSSRIYSDNANIIIKDTEFGSPSSPSTDTEPKTAFNAKALKGAITITSSVINADNVLINALELDPLKPEVVLFNGKSVTFEGVNIAPTDSDKGRIEVNSALDLTVSKGTTAQANSFKAYRIILDAKNNMTLRDLAVDHVSDANPTKFTARAGNDLTMDTVGLSKAAEVDLKAARDLDMANVRIDRAKTVSLDAQTLVLSDVHFNGTADVTLTSGAGVLSTPAGREQITKGWVNVLKNVTYGPHDLNKLSEQMSTHGSVTGTSVDKSPNAKPSQGIPADRFSAAVKDQFKVELPKLTIAVKK